VDCSRCSQSSITVCALCCSHAGFNNQNHAAHRLNGAKITQIGASIGKPSNPGDSPAAERFSGAKRAAQKHSSVQGLGSHPKAVEDIPVGPGKTGAGMDFEKLIELKLKEQGDAPIGVAFAPQLHHCGNCGRQFAAAALERHRAVCATVFASKRPPMDMSQQRLAGMEGVGVGMGGGGDRYGRAGKSKASRSRGAAGKAGGSAGKDAVAVPVGDLRPALAGGVSRAGKWKQQSEQLRAAMNGKKCDFCRLFRCISCFCC
jgi:hypothetical protein